MKKLITIISLILSLTVFAGNQEQAIRTKFNIGRTIQDVYNKFGYPNVINTGYFMYKNKKFAGFSASMVFYHHKGKVFMTAYMLDSDSNGNACIANYMKIQSMLESKYGEFIKNVVWENTLFKSDTNKYGLALLAGHLKIQHDKSIGDITIINKMYGSNYRSYHFIMYVDSKAQKIAIQDKENKNKEDI